MSRVNANEHDPISMRKAIQELDRVTKVAGDHHKTQHQDGGGDEISVAGLSGELADVQKPKINGLTDIGEALADGDEVAVYNLSGTANRKSAVSRFFTFIWSKVVAFANKATPLDADSVMIVDSADGNAGKLTTWTQVKAFLKTYLDTLYEPKGVATTDVDFSATSKILGRVTASGGKGEELSLSQVLDLIGSAARGMLLYRGASGWLALSKGTEGYYLKQGANDPEWAAVSADALRHTNDFRPTLESGVPVSTTNQTAKYVVYICAKSGGASTNGQIALWNGSAWAIYEHAENAVYPGGTKPCNTVNGSTTLTLSTGTTRALLVGEKVSGSGIPVGTTVVSIDSLTTLTISAAATADQSAETITFLCPAGKNYDIFEFVDSGTVYACLGPAWTNDTTRATGLTVKDGVKVLSGAYVVGGTSYAEGRLRHIGSVGITATDGQTEFSFVLQTPRLLICSADNKVKFRAFSQDPTFSWSYTTASARAINGDANNKIEFLLPDSASVFAQLMIQTNKAGYQHVSLDTASMTDADPTYRNAGFLYTNDAADVLTNVAVLAKQVAYGRHAVIPTEYGQTGNTTYGETNMGFLLEVEL